MQPTLIFCSIWAQLHSSSDLSIQLSLIYLLQLQACSDKAEFSENLLGDKEKSLEDARRVQADQTIEIEKCGESLVS